MNFRRKLLLIFALTVFLSVAAVAWIGSLVTRRAFEQSNEERSAALVAQFQREFKRHADDVANVMKRVGRVIRLFKHAMRHGQVRPATLRKMHAILDEALLKLEELLSLEEL